MAMGCRQCLSLSVVQLKGKHCQKPYCRNAVPSLHEKYHKNVLQCLIFSLENKCMPTAVAETPEP